MMKLQGLLSLATACVALAAAPMPAQADTQTTWAFSFTGALVEFLFGVSGSGEFVTEGDSTATAQPVIAVSGSYQDLFTPSSEIALVPLNTDTYFDYDNEFGGGAPWVSGDGVLFSTDGSNINLFSSNGVDYIDDHVLGLLDIVVPVDLTVTLVGVVTVVPEPATRLLLLGGLGAFGLAAAVRRRRPAVVQSRRPQATKSGLSKPGLP